MILRSQNTLLNPERVVAGDSVYKKNEDRQIVIAGLHFFIMNLRVLTKDRVCTGIPLSARRLWRHLCVGYRKLPTD